MYGPAPMLPMLSLKVSGNVISRRQKGKLHGRVIFQIAFNVKHITRPAR
jgi:hypothetical protein